MRNYQPRSYQELIENTDLHELKEYMSEEIAFIQKVNAQQPKVFIELGAGYGRVLPDIISYVEGYIGVEINEHMYQGLQERAEQYPNAFAIQGDFIDLPRLIKSKVKDEHRVYLLLQNTLGTIEGERKTFLKSLKKTIQRDTPCELVVSVFKQESLESFGVKLYQSINSICGDIDYSKSDFSLGYIKTTTGYTSKWWRKEEVVKIIEELNGTLENVKEEEHFRIFHVQFEKDDR